MRAQPGSGSGDTPASRLISQIKLIALNPLTAGELAERGALETIAHYLQLLEEACLVAGVRKYSERAIRQRAAPPKLTVLNHGLMGGGRTQSWASFLMNGPNKE